MSPDAGAVWAAAGLSLACELVCAVVRTECPGVECTRAVSDICVDIVGCRWSLAVGRIEDLGAESDVSTECHVVSVVTCYASRIDTVCDGTSMGLSALSH